MNFSVTQFGKHLDPLKYNWDEKTLTFSTKENNLVLDFNGIDGVTFKTGSSCTFNTGDSCTFNTGYSCIFNTGSSCIFKTSENCVAIRYDVEGITEIPIDKTIKFNGNGISGYTIIEKEKKSDCEGKVIEIEGKKYKLVSI